MQVIAHRGANREALENSWSAFELAVDGGALRIELDVQLTADGHAAVMHDDDFSRTAERPGRLSALTRAQVAKIKLRNGEAIPFLDEVVAKLLPRIELNIEIKGRSTELARVVAETVERHGSSARKDAVIVSCFHAEPLVWIKDHYNDLKRACLWSTETFSWPFFAILAPQVFLDRAGTNIFHPWVKLVDANMMDQARARGWVIYAWSGMQDEEKDRDGLWTAMKTVGLDGLCTNYPRQLKTWLEEAAIDERNYLPERFPD